MALTAEEKEAKQKAKQERQAEKDQIANLKSAQKAEVLALKTNLAGQGLSNKEIQELVRNEKLANKEELRTAKTTIADPGVQWIGQTVTRPDGTTGKGPILSQMQTIPEQYRSAVDEDLKGALSYYKDYNIPAIAKRGDATLGFGLNQLLKAEYSKDPTSDLFGKQNNLFKTLDRAQSFVNKSVTPEQLQEQGLKLKQDKRNPDLYTMKVGGGDQTGYVFFKQNPDGSYTGLGANRVKVDTPNTGALGQVFKSVPFLPEVAAIGASFIPGAQPYVGQIYAAGKGLQTAAMGGDFGDIAKNMALSYLGSNILPGVIQSAIPGGVSSAIASVPGATQGISSTVSNLLSGRDLGESLQAGLATGLGSYAGPQIGQATQSPLTGRLGGALTTGLLSGGDLSNILQNVAMGEAMRTGIESARPVTTQAIPDPRARSIFESTIPRAINRALSSGPDRPVTPAPVTSSVMARLNNPQFTGTRIMAKGGYVKPPIRRNISELIPLNRGGLSSLRGM